MWVFPRAGRPTVRTKILPAWNRSPDAVVYRGATIAEVSSRMQDDRLDACLSAYLVPDCNQFVGTNTKYTYLYYIHYYI